MSFQSNITERILSIKLHIPTPWQKMVYIICSLSIKPTIVQTQCSSLCKKMTFWLHLTTNQEYIYFLHLLIQAVYILSQIVNWMDHMHQFAAYNVNIMPIFWYCGVGWCWTLNTCLIIVFCGCVEFSIIYTAWINKIGVCSYLFLDLNLLVYVLKMSIKIFLNTF